MQCVVTSPPYFGLRKYSQEGSSCNAVFGGDVDCRHKWIEEARFKPGRGASGRQSGLGAPREAGASQLGYGDATGRACAKCGAWRGELGHEPTPQLYIGHLVSIFREVRRVLRPDGVCFVVMGDSYAGGHVVSGGRLQHRAGAHRPESTFMAPRMTKVQGFKSKDLIGIPWMLAFAMRDDGWWLRQDNVWAKPNPMPENVRDRTIRSHEYVFHFAKSARYYYDTDAVSEPWAGDTSRRLSQPDLDAQMGGYKAEAYEADFPGKKQRDRRPADILRAMRNGRKGTKNLRSVWRVNTEAWPGAHFATFPRKIARRCVLGGSRQGDVVLDPFCGTGTTVEVAWSLKRVGIGIDLVESYCRDHAVKRFRRGYAQGRQMALALDG